MKTLYLWSLYWTQQFWTADSKYNNYGMKTLYRVVKSLKKIWKKTLIKCIYKKIFIVVTFFLQYFLMLVLIKDYLQKNLSTFFLQFSDAGTNKGFSKKKTLFKML